MDGWTGISAVSRLEGRDSTIIALALQGKSFFLLGLDEPSSHRAHWDELRLPIGQFLTLANSPSFDRPENGNFEFTTGANFQQRHGQYYVN